MAAEEVTPTVYDFRRITPRGFITGRPFRRRSDINSSIEALEQEDERLTNQLYWYGELQEQFEDFQQDPNNQARYNELQTVMNTINAALQENGTILANKLNIEKGIPIGVTFDRLGLPEAPSAKRQRTGQGLHMKGGRIKIHGNFHKKV